MTRKARPATPGLIVGGGMCGSPRPPRCRRLRAGIATPWRMRGASCAVPESSDQRAVVGDVVLSQPVQNLQRIDLEPELDHDVLCLHESVEYALGLALADGCGAGAHSVTAASADCVGLDAAGALN